MDMDQALRLHSQLAHALLHFWEAFPAIQPLVCSQLSMWRDLQVTDRQFLDRLVQDFQAIGVADKSLLAAVASASGQPVDDYLGCMFVKALTCATRLYSRYGAWSGGDAVSLDDVGGQNSPYPEKVLGAFGVSGKTRPGVPGRDAVVTLHRVPQRLGPPSWASIPYVLCHELLCHASQAASSSDVTDPFTEGWMDEVAASVHGKQTATLFPWLPGTAAIEGRRLCEALRVLRDDLDDLEKKARSARIQGAYAARIVRKILARLAELSPLTGRRSLFERLSVELNAVAAASPKEYLGLHQTFVSNVIAGEQYPALGTRRDAVLRKWVARQVSASEVLSFM